MFAIGLPPQQAIEYFKSKGYAFTWNWDEMLNEAHAKAFTVAKAMNLDVLQDIRGMVQKALDDGITAKQFQDELEPMLKAKGWWGKMTTADGEAQLGSPRRLRTIYQTNMQSAYMAGTYKAFMENADDRPYWQYNAIMDQRTRPGHAALNGKVFRYDDPFWDSFFPPIDWGCRCSARALDYNNLRERNLKVEKTGDNLTTEQRQVSTGESSPITIYKNPVTGEKTVTGVGWNSNPGAAWQLDVMAYEKALALPPEIRNAFIGEMARAKIHQEMFPSWVDSIVAKQMAKGYAVTTGWMDVKVMDALKEKGLEPVTPVITIDDKQILHITLAKTEGIALSTEEIKRIPEYISNPDAVLWDKQKQNILYVVSSSTDDRKNKIVVEVNYDLKGTGKTNLIVTSGKVSLIMLRDRNIYEVITGKLE